MKKYIDANKLASEVKKLNIITKTYEEQVSFSTALLMVTELIDTLSKEQPEINLEKDTLNLAKTVNDMTQKEKELLLKDLCARLPYGVNICIKYYDLQGDGELASRDLKLTAGNICYCFDNGHWVDIKPYLRPMSSMTEEEKEEFEKTMRSCTEKILACPTNERWYQFFDAEEQDFMNAHHFDYRGLIEMELALEAPDGMYK